MQLPHTSIKSVGYFVFPPDIRHKRKLFKERGIELVISQEIPEAEGTKKAFIVTFPVHHISVPEAKSEDD